MEEGLEHCRFCCLLVARHTASMSRSGCCCTGPLSALVRLPLAPSLMRLLPGLLALVVEVGKARTTSFLGLSSLQEGELGPAGEAASS